MFKYNEDEERYLAVVDGVEFASEEEPELSDEEVRSLAERSQRWRTSLGSWTEPSCPKPLDGRGLIWMPLRFLTAGIPWMKHISLASNFMTALRR